MPQKNGKGGCLVGAKCHKTIMSFWQEMVVHLYVLMRNVVVEASIC